MQTKIFTKLLVTILLPALLLGFSTSRVYATKHIITTASFFFSPSSLSINLGDTLVWQWMTGKHTTTSSVIPPGAVPWDAPLKNTATTFTYVPAVVGTYDYVCTPHQFTQNMIGSFTVVCPTPTVEIGADGPTTFCKGGSVGLGVEEPVDGDYQWKLNGNNIVGETGPTLDADATGSYTLVFTNGCGSSATSNAINVTVNPKPKADFTIGACNSGAVLLTRTGTPANGVTFKWKLNNVNIPGATNSTFSATVTGSYKVEVTITATGCKKASPAKNVAVNCKSASMPEFTVDAYPNPSSSSFNIKASGKELQLAEIVLYDLSGQMINKVPMEKNNATVGEELSPGVYFAKVVAEGVELKLLRLVKTE